MENVVLKSLLTNETYAQATFTYLKDEFFQGDFLHLWKAYKTIYLDHGVLPTLDIIKYEIDQLPIKSSSKDSLDQFITGAFTTPVPDKVVKLLVDKTEKWGLERSVYNAIVDGINEFDDDKRDFGKIHNRLKEAIAYSFDSSIGTSYFLDAESRFEEYTKQTAKIAFLIKVLDDMTENGYEKGTLNLGIATSGGGKSILLVNIAASAIQQGLNVFYATMELSETKISQRLDAKLFDIEMKEVKAMDKKQFMSYIQKLQSKTHGDIIVKQYPTGSATVLDIKHTLDELKLKKNWVPDVVITDYLGIMASSRTSKGDNTYISQKQIAEDLRALGIELDVPVWSAVQFNRGAYGNSNGGLENISDSMAVIHTADFVVSIFQNDELQEMQQAVLKALKNRYGEVNVTGIVGLDKAKMSFHDVEGDVSQTINKYKDEYISDEEVTKFSPSAKSRSFEDLLVG